MKETCENCDFWQRWPSADQGVAMPEKADGTDGVCFRFPPRYREDEGLYLWPCTKQRDWCGEWKGEPATTCTMHFNPGPECLDKILEDVAGEKCVSCGQVGADRCTLSMSCGIPMTDADDPPTKYRVPFQRPDRSGTNSPYTLRVCKSCRADWLKAIGSWFTFMVMPDRSSVDQQFTQLRQTLERANVDLDTLRRRCVDELDHTVAEKLADG